MVTIRSANTGCLGKAIGFPLLLAGILLLIWNEHHTLHVGRLLVECRQKLVSVPDTSRIDPANEGMLLFMNAWARQGDDVQDPFFAVRGRYMVLERHVEYHQWKESSHMEHYTDANGDRATRTIYDYERVWSDELIDNHNFQGNAEYTHDNTPLTKIEPLKVYSRGAMFGPYFIHPELMDSLPRIAEDQNCIDPTAPQFVAALDSTTHHGKVKSHVFNDTIYYGDIPESPLVGDVRVVFRYYRPCHIWALAQAHGDSIRPFVSSEGYWQTFARFSGAEFEPEEAIEFEVWGQNLLTWMLRVMGWLMLVFGIKKILDIVVGLLRGVPVVGALLSATAFVISLVLGTFLALLVIGLAFVFLRPWLGVGILCGLGVLWFGANYLYRRKHPAAAPSAMPPSRPLPPPLPPKQ
ncbi:MAG: TMEM43 family protein [Muribaculaceae bacterium]|nr:TMEM43 family protein [Muribaculaceae bacterium]